MKPGKLFKRMFNSRPIDNYVSGIDRFLEAFDKTHHEDFYAAAERKKHEKIFYLRDHAVKKDVNRIIWKEF